MQKRRTFTEISGLVLMLLQEGPQMRRLIRQRLGIDSRTLNRCLDTLAKYGLVSVSDKYIEITEKGLHFVDIYREFIQLLEQNNNNIKKQEEREEES